MVVGVYDYNWAKTIDLIHVNKFPDLSRSTPENQLKCDSLRFQTNPIVATGVKSRPWKQISPSLNKISAVAPPAFITSSASIVI
jgi:hypothetical protein